MGLKAPHQIIVQQRVQHNPRRLLDFRQHAIKLLLRSHQRIDMLHRQYLRVLRSCCPRDRRKSLRPLRQTLDEDGNSCPPGAPWRKEAQLNEPEAGRPHTPESAGSSHLARTGESEMQADNSISWGCAPAVDAWGEGHDFPRTASPRPKSTLGFPHNTAGERYPPHACQEGGVVDLLWTECATTTSGHWHMVVSNASGFHDHCSPVKCDSWHHRHNVWTPRHESNQQPRSYSKRVYSILF